MQVNDALQMVVVEKMIGEAVRETGMLLKIFGTLIPSAQRLVWAAKQPLGNAALGALFA